MARKVKGLKKKTKLTAAKILSRQGKPGSAARKISKRVFRRRASQEAWFDRNSADLTATDALASSALICKGATEIDKYLYPLQ
jgi:hypothetical protein